MMEWKYCPSCGEGLHLRGTARNPYSACSGCGFQRYNNPLPTTIGIVRRAGRYLLLRRAKAPRLGEWDAVGGFLEPGESAEQCLMREAREEIGCELTNIRIFGTYSSVYGEGGSHTVGIAFLCDLPPDSSIVLSEENDAHGWFLGSELPPLAFRDVNDAFKDAVAGPRQA